MTTNITRLLTLTGAAGDRIEFTLTLDGDGVKSSRFTGHYGTARSVHHAEVACLYKVAPGAPGRRAIENEVAVLSGLSWAGMNDGQFAELLGYDLDPDEGGAVLVQTRRGRALRSKVSTTVPTEEQLWQPTHDLLSALVVLADHNYVHGAISPTTVLWDGVGLQIADLSTVTSQKDGEGFSRDVRNAAGLLYWFATGETSSFGYHSESGSPDEEYRHLTMHRPRLAMVLAPVYGRSSPTLKDLLDRMADWPRPDVRPPATNMEAGRRMGEDDKTTHVIGSSPGTASTLTPHTRYDMLVPPPPAHRSGNHRFRRHLAEKLRKMHGGPDRPERSDRGVGTSPFSHPGASRPLRPEPGTLPPFLKDVLLRVHHYDIRQLQPFVWVVTLALIILILLVVFS